VFLEFEGNGKCKGPRPMTSEVELEKICKHYKLILKISLK